VSKKINNTSAELELTELDPRTDISRATRSATRTISICAVIIVLVVIGVMAFGLMSRPVVMYTLAGLLIAMVLLCVISMLDISRRFSRYQKKLVDAVSSRIRGAAAGDMDAAERDAYDYLPVDEPIRDGLSAVLTEVNSVRQTSSELSQQLETVSEERDEYQFRMLGARMIPGLIERAIRKIGRVADQRRINDISAFSHNLCDLMNSSLQAANKPISLASELGLIRTYLDLDDAITGRKTEYRMTVMCSIVGYKLVPHLVLPVVENLLEYSERKKDTKYELAIEITSDQNSMNVIIRDNGRGIDVDTLEKLQKGIEDNTIDLNGDPLSLPGIHRRIALCYGNDYGLQVSSSMLGTSVRLTLPPKPDPLYDSEF